MKSSVLIDDLTGLPLRGAFFDRAAATLEAARSEGGEPKLALLVIDVDAFKLVNDTFGHLQGDEVLRQVADLIRRKLRPGELVARYAGDEFVVLIPGANLDEAIKVARDVCEAVRAHAFPMRDQSGTLSSTLSIGAAAYPDHGSDVETVFAAADRAMYQAKRQGRDGVIAASSGSETPQHVPLAVDRFVGRVTETRALVSLLEEAIAGKPQMVAIRGEAGVGKTTLVNQLGPEVRLRAGMLVKGRCHEADVQPPYAPWSEVIGGIPGASDADPRAWQELPNIIPAMAARNASGVRGGGKYVLLSEIAEYIRDAATRAPIVVVLDDMQWADTASWDALEYLIGQLTDERILICLTIRGEELRGESLDRLQRLSRDQRFHDLVLERLEREEVKSWIEAAFHRKDIGREFLALLYRYTEGNPLFVVNVLRTLVEDGAIWHNGDRWEWRPVSEIRLPTTIADLIARRLSHLSTKSRAILTAAAVIGRAFELDIAADAELASEEELLNAVDEGIATSVLQATTTHSGDQYSFAHSRLAEVLRESLNPRRRRKIHQRIARAMEARSPDAISEIASHYDRGGDQLNAFRCALQAARLAREVYAHEEGAGFLRIAERNAVSPGELAEVRERLAEVMEAMGHYEEAEELCDMAIEWYTTQADRARALTLRRTRERLRSLLGQPARRTLEACRGLEAEAVVLGLARERVSLLGMISQASARLGDAGAAENVARACVDLAQELGDSGLLADALNRFGVTLIQRDSSQVGEILQRALLLYQENDDARGQANCRNNLSVMHMLRGEWQAAQQNLTAAIELGRKAGALDMCGLFSLNLGVVHMKNGEYDLARTLCTEACNLFVTVKNVERELYAVYNLAHIERECGHHDMAVELYRKAALLAKQVGQDDVEIGATAGAGLVLLRQGDLEQARAMHVAAEGFVRSRTTWFQGRELAEALGIRIAAQERRTADTGSLFSRACALAETSDLYGAIWLTLECADVLLENDPEHFGSSVTRYGDRVSQLGYNALGVRYAELLSQIRGRVPSGRATEKLAS